MIMKIFKNTWFSLTIICIMVAFIISPATAILMAGFGVFTLSIFRMLRSMRFKTAELLALIGSCLVIAGGAFGIFTGQDRKEFVLLVIVGSIIIGLGSTQKEPR